MTNEDLLSVDTTDDFVAAIPSLIGVIPENNTVIVIVMDGQTILRVALVAPLAAEGFRKLTEHLVTYADDKFCMVLALITDDLILAKDALAEFGDQFPLPAASVLFIKEYVVGAPYIDVLNKVSSTVPDWSNTDIAAVMVSQGKVVSRTMAEIVAMYEPTEPASLVSVPRQVDLWPWLTKLAEAITEGQPYDPAKIGGLLTHSEKARDAAMEATFISAYNAHAIFAEAGRRLRGPARVEALTAAGLAAYVEGEGIMARTAFDAATETANLCEPDYEPKLAIALNAALDCAIPPEIISHTVFPEAHEENHESQD